MISIEKSSIHGVGVIAKTLIKKETNISVLYRHILYGGTHSAYKFCGFNHSCANNLERVVSKTKGHLFDFVAVRDIMPGEELTVFYPFMKDCNEECNCPTCKQESIRFKWL